MCSITSFLCLLAFIVILREWKKSSERTMKVRLKSLWYKVLTLAMLFSWNIWVFTMKCIQPYHYVQSLYFSLILSFQPGKLVGDFLPDLWQVLCLPEAHQALDFQLEHRFPESITTCICILPYPIWFPGTVKELMPCLIPGLASEPDYTYNSTKKKPKTWF